MGDEATNVPSTRRSRLAGHPLSRRRQLTVEQLSAGIYGTIVVSATMAGAAGLPLNGVLLSGFTTVVVYWVAEEYADGLAHRFVTGRHTRDDILHGLRERFTMLEASLLPVLTVLVAGILGASVSTAVTFGLIAAAASLTTLGAVAARRSGMSAFNTLLAGLVAAALGGAVILLKLVLH
jgi:hypothetical protein